MKFHVSDIFNLVYAKLNNLRLENTSESFVLRGRKVVYREQNFTFIVFSLYI